MGAAEFAYAGGACMRGRGLRTLAVLADAGLVDAGLACKAWAV